MYLCKVVINIIVCNTTWPAVGRGPDGAQDHSGHVRRVGRARRRRLLRQGLHQSGSLRRVRRTLGRQVAGARRPLQAVHGAGTWSVDTTDDIYIYHTANVSKTSHVHRGRCSALSICLNFKKKKKQVHERELKVLFEIQKYKGRYLPISEFLSTKQSCGRKSQ